MIVSSIISSSSSCDNDDEDGDYRHCFVLNQLNDTKFTWEENTEKNQSCFHPAIDTALTPINIFTPNPTPTPTLQ